MTLELLVGLAAVLAGGIAATATAIGIVVDAARMPVYLATEWQDMRRALYTTAAATAGVLVGTVWGVRLLRRIPEAAFRRGIGVLVLALGVFMLVRGLRAGF